MKLIYHISIILSLLLLSACSNDTSIEEINTEQQGKLLAEVDDVKIFQSELDNLLVEMFGEYQALSLDDQSREKALKSLVATKSMAKLAKKELSKEGLEKIDFKVLQYRENLLVNEYVKNNGTMQHISNKMVEDYYYSHLEKFGEMKLPKYELLTTDTILPLESRDEFIHAYQKVNKNKGLKHIKDKMKSIGIILQHHKGLLGEGVMQSEIENFIQSQQLQKPSDLTFINDRPYIVLIVSVQTKAAEPLSVVRQDIRKNLTVLQLKKAIKTLSEAAVKQSNIVYR